jgi:hypothetical protein
LGGFADRVRIAPTWSATCGVIVHPMRFVALFASVATALVFSGSAAARAESCAPHGVDVLAAAGAARAYRDKNLNVFVCRRGVPPRYLGLYGDSGLMSSCTGTLLDDVRVTPKYVAWSTDRMCHDDPVIWAVHVRPIARIAMTHSYLTGDCQPACTARRSIGPAEHLALNPRGGVAWSAWDVSQSTVHRVFEISTVVAGQPRRLARGADIDPRSVRWVGRHVRWTQAGTRHSF